MIITHRDVVIAFNMLLIAKGNILLPFFIFAS